MNKDIQFELHLSNIFYSVKSVFGILSFLADNLYVFQTGAQSHSLLLITDPYF